MIAQQDITHAVQTADILAILERRGGGPFKKAANTNGGEHHGACANCGGKDRCVVWPNHPSGKPQAMCRPATQRTTNFSNWR